MDVEKHHMRSHVARPSVVKQWKAFDWERAARWIKEVNPHTAEAGLLWSWSDTSDVIWTDGEPVADAGVFLVSDWDVPTLALDGRYEECWRLISENPGAWADKVWPAEALAIIGASADAQTIESVGSATSDARPDAQPELTPERFGEYCDYCIESHPAPCRDARESLGRKAVRLLVEDYGEEFVNNLLRSHKV